MLHTITTFVTLKSLKIHRLLTGCSSTFPGCTLLVVDDVSSECEGISCEWGCRKNVSGGYVSLSDE